MSTNRELARKRPAEVVPAREEPIWLVATARPVPRPAPNRRIMTMADLPAHVVLLMYTGLAAPVVWVFILVAEYLDK
jgi:hypothetical protein